ncbi:hypothetical protein LSAT2_031372 [Lamellibrachia satsuma]|nr:hypothetical protein LSAT2_031372 [Lamellibrachia satsuma]
MALNVTLSALLLISLAVIGDRGATGFFMKNVRATVLECVQHCLQLHERCQYPVETKDPSVQKDICRGLLGSCARDCRRSADERIKDIMGGDIKTEIDDMTDQ